MENYKDFTNFSDYVKDNVLFDIKLELTNMIILLNGDRKKIDDAIEYAKANSDFDFEKHQPTDTNISLDTNEDKFVFEKGELLNNFSKERLNEVFSLYPLMFNEKEIIDKSNLEVEELSNDFIDPTTKKVVVIASAVFLTYILYRILK